MPRSVHLRIPGTSHTTIWYMRTACRKPKANCCFSAIPIARCHLNVTLYVRQISILPCHSPARLQCRPLYLGLSKKTLYATVILSHSWPISCSSHQQLFHQLNCICWDADSIKFTLHCVVQPLSPKCSHKYLGLKIQSFFFPYYTRASCIPTQK